MEPEDTDKYQRFEQLIHRLTKVPKKEVDEAAEAAGKDASDKPSDDASETRRHED